MDYSIASNFASSTARPGQTATAAPQRPLAVAAPVDDAPAASDRVELSDAARLYRQIPEQPFRADKVADIRNRLADGSYLAPEQLDAAVEGLLRDVNLLA